MTQRDRQDQVMHPDWFETVCRAYGNIVVSHTGGCCMELQVWLIPRALGPGSPNFRDSIRFSTEWILQSMDGLIWIFHKSSCLKVLCGRDSAGTQQSQKTQKLNWTMGIHGPWDHALSTRTGSKMFQGFSTTSPNLSWPQLSWAWNSERKADALKRSLGFRRDVSMQSITNHLTIASTWLQSVLQAQCRNWLLAMWHAACAVLSFQAFQRCCATEEQKKRGSINSHSSVYTADPKFLEAWKTCYSRQTELYSFISFRLLRFHVKKSDFTMWMATRSVLRHFEHQGCCPAGQLYLWVGRCWQVHLQAAFLYVFVLVTKTDSSLDNSYGTPFPWHFQEVLSLGSLHRNTLLGTFAGYWCGGAASRLCIWYAPEMQWNTFKHYYMYKSFNRHDMWLNTSVCWFLTR